MLSGCRIRITAASHLPLVMFEPYFCKTIFEPALHQDYIDFWLPTIRKVKGHSEPDDRFQALRKLMADVVCKAGQGLGQKNGIEPETSP